MSSETCKGYVEFGDKKILFYHPNEKTKNIIVSFKKNSEGNYTYTYLHEGTEIIFESSTLLDLTFQIKNRLKEGTIIEEGLDIYVPGSFSEREPYVNYIDYIDFDGLIKGSHRKQLKFLLKVLILVVSFIVVFELIKKIK